MEQRLSRYSKQPTRPPGLTSIGANTACNLLQENQRLSTMKKEIEQQERCASRELVEGIFERDRQNLAHDQMKQQKRRETHQALAQKYKSAIVQKELAMAQDYAKKLESGPHSEFFPFVEGETVEKHRESQNLSLREEMQDFLKSQRESQPPRNDSLMQSVSHQHSTTYSLGNHSSKPIQTLGGSGVAPHIAGRHPKFLQRPQDHRSRRINDEHVKATMTLAVDHTVQNLKKRASEKHSEVRDHENGMMINDALRYDNALMKQIEREKNAEFLKVQQLERKKRAEQERQEFTAAPAGYWGPEEKALQPGSLHTNNCTHIIHQMEVDQNRRLYEQHARLQEERKINQNSMQEMAKDRMMAMQKREQHKAVLTQTWKNQEKINRAKIAVDSIGC